MTDISPSDLCSVAEAAAEAGAKLLQEEHKRIAKEGVSVPMQTKGSIFDPVCNADKEAQDRIVAVITKHFPAHRILAEEERVDTDEDPACPYRWIIDPLDGTGNFLRGREAFGTIVAVEKEGVLLAGCIVLPILEKRFSAAKGEGVLANGKPAELRRTSGMTDAVICSNITRRAISHDDGILRTTLPYCASIENYGCTALAISEILLGRNDGLVVKGLRIWDVAAGILMIEELGGKARYEYIEDGNERGGIVCVATTEPIFEEVCDFAFTKKLA